MELHGQRILVMGASGGAGAAIVEAMIACGGDVIAAARRRTALFDLRASLRHHDRLHTAECDATDADGVEALFASIETRGPLDGVVHATRAGAGHVVRVAATRMRARGRGFLVLVGSGDALAQAADEARRTLDGTQARVHWVRTDTPEDCAVIAPAVVRLVSSDDAGSPARNGKAGTS